jgi:hypothetical protein
MEDAQVATHLSPKPFARLKGVKNIANKFTDAEIVIARNKAFKPMYGARI